MAPRSKARSKTAELPKGFSAIGGFGTTWPADNTKPGEAIAGIITDYNYDVKTPHGVTDNLKIESADGTVYTVWSSAMLGILFGDDDYTDVDVWIRFDGLGKKKGKKNPPKLFTVAADLA